MTTLRGPPGRALPGLLDTWEPSSPSPQLELPEDDESFTALARFLTVYFIDYIDGPLTLQQIQLLPSMVRLAQALSQRNNPSMIAALLWCRMDFAAHTADEDRHGISNARALACEVVAIECVGYLSEHDVVQYLSYEVPGKQDGDGDEDEGGSEGGGGGNRDGVEGDAERLLSSGGNSRYGSIGRAGGGVGGLGIVGGGGGGGGQSVPGSGITTPVTADDIRGMESELAEDIVATCGGLNTLEIAIVAGAKHFLSQKSVQHVVDGIWEGRVVFWEGLNVTGRKRPHIYNKRKADPYSRLRVPKYQKFFEACFLASFTILYYAVLVERNPDRITNTETVLLFFFVAFAIEEFTQWIDAGTLFYSSDIWSWLDMFVILIGLAFLACRIIGLVKEDEEIVDTSFDILSLEALFLVPRAFSLLSLHPYFGVLIPCLKQMTKDFGKFMVLVGILYLGFLSTFSILGRDKFTMMEMSALMTRVFFGGTGAGFDAMKLISPILGPPLMVIFIILTNILLITSLISLLSNSLNNMMNNARQEYLFMYSTFVMGSVTSNRLTYFYPPLNLIPLIFLRPMRLFLSSTQVRRVRIVLLKFTHFPLVAAIAAYEGVSRSRNKTNRTITGGSSFRQPMGASGFGGPGASKGVLLNRKGAELAGRVLLGSNNFAVAASAGVGGGGVGSGRPSVAATGMAGSGGLAGGVGRSSSVNHIGSGAAAADRAEREAKRTREMILELSLKLDTLLAKQ